MYVVFILNTHGRACQVTPADCVHGYEARLDGEWLKEAEGLEGVEGCGGGRGGGGR